MQGLKENKTKVRNLGIDVLKGVGISLVVIGHNITDPTFIYCFHMPLFFMISGFLFSPKAKAKYLKKSTLRLLVPYLCFLFIVSLPELLFTIRGGDLKEGAVLIIRLLYGGEILKGAYAVFWYVSVLWIAANLFNLMLEYGVKLYGLPILIVLAYLTTLIPHPLPWNIQVVPMAIVYLWIGYIFRQRIEQFKSIFLSHKILFAISAIIVLGIIYICRENLTMDMKYNQMGIPVLSLISSILASVSVVILSVLFIRWKPLVKVLVSIGGASMVIMYLHMPIKFYIGSHWTLANAELVNIILGIVVSLIIYAMLKNNRLGRRYLLGIA